MPQRTLISADEIELKVACPHAVDNVKPLREAAGPPIQQAFLGHAPMAGWRISPPLRRSSRAACGRRHAPAGHSGLGGVTPLR